MKLAFTSKLEKFDSDLWGHHIVVPTDIARQYIEGEDRRVICTLEGKEGIQCGLMPMGDDLWFINLNQKVRKKLKLEIGNTVHAELEKDRSEYGLPITEEFQELLEQDTEGNTLFHALTPGKQRNLLYIAQQVKSPDKRLKRAMVIMEHLKIHDKLDFRALNQEIRDMNKREL